jgi:hypothetical protein
MVILAIEVRSIAEPQSHANPAFTCGAERISARLRVDQRWIRNYKGGSVKGSFAFVMFLLVGWLASPAFSQNVNASISGTVEDPTHALIPGVSITAENIDTGIKTTTVSNEVGVYNLVSIQPGLYKLNAELPGFEVYTYTNIQLGSGQQVRLNFVLKVAAATGQSVEVNVPVDTVLTQSSASAGFVLPADRVRELPLVGNSVQDLVAIMPGVTSSTGGFSALGVANKSEGSYDSMILGQLPGTMNITRDGLNNSAAGSSYQAGFQSATILSPDMVGEFRVVLAPVDAEYGRGSGQIQVLTRGGTNRYRGSAVWFARNSALDAKSPVCHGRRMA